MYPRANYGSDQNNRKFSACSLEYMSAVVHSLEKNNKYCLKSNLWYYLRYIMNYYLFAKQEIVDLFVVTVLWKTMKNAIVVLRMNVKKHVAMTHLTQKKDVNLKKKQNAGFYN